MENKRPPRPNFSKLAQGLMEKERKRNSPHDVIKQDEQKLNPDKRHNKYPPIQNSQRLDPIKPPQQKNLLEDKKTVNQQSKSVKKQNKKPALYRPEPSNKNSSDPWQDSEKKPALESSGQPTSTWDEEIKINTNLIPEVEDFIAFEKSNAAFKYIAEEESKVYETPWFDPSSYNLKLSPTDRLQLEVTSLIEYLSPTPAEIAVRHWLCHSVEKAAQSIFPTAKVSIFGSFSTQLFLPSSDVDLVVFIPEITDELDVVPCLKKISKVLSKKLDIVHIDVRGKAKVPIINFFENQSELEVDISLNIDSGLASRTLILNFLDQCPAIRPLIMIVKHFMELKELNKVYNGGLGSYAITLLVISFIQIHPRIRSGEIDPNENLGVLLVEFFELYGPSFNPNNVGITLTNGGRYYRKVKKHTASSNLRVSPLELLDPQDETNNVARSSHGFINAQTAFTGAFATLTQNLLQYNRHLERSKGIPYATSILGSILNIPQSTIERRLKHEEIWNKLA